MSNLPEYVCYVHPSCPHSQRAMKLTSQMKSVLVQNVATISDKPSWLTGVPILANTHLGVVYKGSDAFTLLSKLLQQHQSKLLDTHPEEKDPPRKAEKLTSISDRSEKQESAITSDMISELQARRSKTLHPSN